MPLFGENVSFLELKKGWMLEHKAASDDAFTDGILTSDWIVLEQGSMCSVHPVAFNSDWHILSGCFCCCLCEHMCVCGCNPHAASRNRKQGKLSVEMSANWAMLSSGQSFPDMYLLLRKINNPSVKPFDCGTFWPEKGLKISNN